MTDGPAEWEVSQNAGHILYRKQGNCVCKECEQDWGTSEVADVSPLLRSSPPNANGLALEDRQRLKCHAVYTSPSNLHTDRRTPTELDDFTTRWKNVLTKIIQHNKHVELFFFFTFYSYYFLQSFSAVLHDCFVSITCAWTLSVL